MDTFKELLKMKNIQKGSPAIEAINKITNHDNTKQISNPPAIACENATYNILRTTTVSYTHLTLPTIYSV